MDKKVTLEMIAAIFKCKWHMVKYDTKRPPAQISLVTGGLPYEQNN